MGNVTHPSHYNAGKFEVIEVIEDQFPGLGFHAGNVVKYTCRAGKKDPSKRIEDLEKAQWYLTRMIELLKAQRDNRQPIRPNDMNPKTVTPKSDAAESPCAKPVGPTSDFTGQHTRAPIGVVLREAKRALEFYAGLAPDAGWKGNTFIVIDKFGMFDVEAAGPYVAKEALKYFHGLGGIAK